MADRKYTKEHALALLHAMDVVSRMPSEKIIKRMKRWMQKIVLSKKELSCLIDASIDDLNCIEVKGWSILSKKDQGRILFLMMFPERAKFNLILGPAKEGFKKQMLDIAQDRLIWDHVKKKP